MGSNASWIDLYRLVTKHSHLFIPILTCAGTLTYDELIAIIPIRYTLLHSSSQFTDMKRRAKQRLDRNCVSLCTYKFDFLRVRGIALEEWNQKPALISCPEPVRFPGSPTLDEIVNYLRPSVSAASSTAWCSGQTFIMNKNLSLL